MRAFFREMIRKEAQYKFLLGNVNGFIGLNSNKNRSRMYYPVSVIRENIRKNSRNTHSILLLCVLSKESTKTIYDNIVYMIPSKIFIEDMPKFIVDKILKGLLPNRI